MSQSICDKDVRGTGLSKVPKAIKNNSFHLHGSFQLTDFSTLENRLHNIQITDEETESPQGKMTSSHFTGRVS